MTEAASEPTLKSTPSAGQEDKLPVDTAVPQKQRLISGSFRFSVSAARDRLRTCNLTGRGEKARAKTEETLAKKVKGQSTAKSEEARGKVQPLDPSSGTKVPENNVVGTSSRPSLQEQLAPVLQEAKGKEPPQDHPSGPEGKTPVRKEDVSTGDEGDGCGNSGQATDGEVDRGAETKRNEIEDVQRGREVVPERNAFGVKLRTTSLSLRYRSDLAQSEPKSKVVVRTCSPPCDPRSSPLPPLATKSSVPEEKQDTSPGSDALRDTPVGTLDDSTGTSQPSISLLKESPSQKSDTPTPSASTLSQPSPTHTEGAGTTKNRDNEHPTNQESAPPKEAEPQVSEPSWMTLARERSRSLQQLLTGRLPGESETLTMENKDKVPDMESKTELTKASPEIHAKVEHAASNRNMSNYKTDIKLEEKTANKIHTPDDAVNDSTVQRRNKDDWRQKRTEPISSPSLMSGGQPSWMELAKRKSLAWSDKTMD
ncbi:hypothetical protein AGOR_G00219380 [Albula goreensis]|uniref:DUF4592 domain-containing protein n=1 Tax=Albula goreensis TaxID=1534307 RepID=A0A8T3CQ12_9TELE|nr:hypothetical protein AGOR_G00219380 [Albula goreensis]